MQRTSLVNNLAIFIVSILLLSTVSFGGVQDDMFWAKPGVNVEAGQICIEIAPSFAPLNPRVLDGIVYTGIPSIDAIADVFGVYKIEKVYHMKETPLDPAEPDLSRYYWVFFPGEFGPFDLIEAFQSCPEVDLAEHVNINYKLYIPNDTRYRNQWHLAHCGFPEAWDYTKGDPEVVIGIVDDGMDMNYDGFLGIHPDIEDNLWVNPEEDIDNDGVITLDDWDGEDNDNNGYVDDFYGWNFTDNSNWPDDYWADRGNEGGHGTHVGGIASAVTDNELGVAGAAFSASLMITAHYSRDNPRVNVGGYRGIEYCASNGADAINLSWGSDSRFAQNEQAALDWAMNQGSVIFAGCGNDSVYDNRNRATHFYPCGYDGVIGVGACDDNDDKADFSNYGDYTDLIAPGVAILSTIPRNSYDAWPGTSMSSPLAAGTGALMLSVMPDLSVGQLLDAMQNTAVDISGRNQNYPGVVYRINADFLINSSHPKYDMSGLEIIEVEGNGDQWMDRGERYTIDFTLSNEEGYRDASNVIIRLQSPDWFVRIESEPVNMGNIDNGDELQIWEADRPVFNIHQSAPYAYSDLRLVVSSDENYEHTFNIPITVRHPMYLVVDDDGGEGYTDYIEQDFMVRPIVHDSWDVSADNLMSQDYLNSFAFVVWITGNERNPLSNAEINLLTSYLNRGGYLVISSQYLGDDQGESDFFTDFLHASHDQDYSGRRRVVGLDGNPISEGLDMLIFGGTGAGNGTLSPSTMDPLNGAELLVEYDDGSNAGLYYAGDDYQVIYLGFALEAVSGSGGTTARSEFLEKILDHLYIEDVGGSSTGQTIPTDFSMSAAYPNPFNSSTRINVKVPIEAEFSLEVFDVSGRIIDTLHNGFAAPGEQTCTWDASNTAAGVYLIKLQSGERSAIQKVVLTK